MSGSVSWILEVAGSMLICLGAFFFIAATVGLIRMPDPYNRGHVAGKGDGPGLMLSMLGVWLYWLTINPAESLKLLLIIFFMFFTNPIVIHAVLRYCYRNGVRPMDGTTEEEVN